MYICHKVDLFLDKQEVGSRTALEAKLSRTRTFDACRFQIHSSMAEAPCTQNRDGKFQTKLNQNQSKEGEGEGSVSCSTLTCIVFISRRLDCISRSVCLLVMPHSATSSVRGDEISSTLSWNSGV